MRDSTELVTVLCLYYNRFLDNFSFIITFKLASAERTTVFYLDVRPVRGPKRITKLGRISSVDCALIWGSVEFIFKPSAVSKVTE